MWLECQYGLDSGCCHDDYKGFAHQGSQQDLVGELLLAGVDGASIPYLYEGDRNKPVYFALKVCCRRLSFHSQSEVLVGQNHSVAGIGVEFFGAVDGGIVLHLLLSRCIEHGNGR